MEGMIPWNGQDDNLVDRFDGRTLLDFYQEPSSHVLNRPKTDEETELEEVKIFVHRCILFLPLLANGVSIPASSLTFFCVWQIIAFEAYRDLINMTQLDVSEADGLLVAERENVAQRASAKSAAVAASAANSAAQGGGTLQASTPAGTKSQFIPAPPKPGVRNCCVIPNCKPSPVVADPKIWRIHWSPITPN